MPTTASSQTPTWDSLGYITFKRTYARRLDDARIDTPTEEYPQTIERVLRACAAQLQVGFTSAEESRLRSYFLTFKGLVAGRFLWQLGTPTVEKLGLLSLQNCAFTNVDDPISPFTWTFDALMLGSGVGFNIQRRNIAKLPMPRPARIVREDSKDADFIIPDKREGWVELLRRVLQAHFLTGQGFSYSTICIRSKGAPIRGFGGVSAGPEDLAWGMQQISQLLNSRAHQPMRSIDALDLMNIIGRMVVAGNVRRSAQIAIGDADDIEFLRSKRWDLGGIPNWRSMSNNSVVCSDPSKLPAEFWEAYLGKGEPFGLINLDLARSIGRLGDTRYPDPEVEGFNPCAEQSLGNRETCALAEIFLPHIATAEELFDVAQLLYRVVKHSLRLKCHQAETQAIVHRNMRMGIGVTGYLQASEQQRAWLPATYEKLRQLDDHYSQQRGWPRSIKLTTCKPSGTLSLLAGVTPGVHPGFASTFIRRIRMASNSALVNACRQHGYPVEFQRNFDGSEDGSTAIVSFPCRFPAGTVLARDLTAVQQLEWVRRLQRDWSDNAVSCTVYYRPHELAEIRAWLLEHFQSGLKSASFLLHAEHGFHQAPYEEISEQHYNELVAKVRPLTATTLNVPQTDILDSLECLDEACPVR